MQSRPFARKTDMTCIAAVILIAAAILLVQRVTAAAAAVTAAIYHGDSIITTTQLRPDDDDVITIPSSPSIIIRKYHGGIEFIASDCPDQVCVHTGRITAPGAFAACLPNQILVILTTPANQIDQEMDTITR